MNHPASPFHYFRGYRLLVLIIVTFAYGLWFTQFGPYATLSTINPGLPLESRLFYTGQKAAMILDSLDLYGRKIKYMSLMWDIPFIILNGLMMEGMFAFAIRRIPLRSPAWNYLFILPILYVGFDVLENSFLALTLATGSVLAGSLASLCTFMKMMTYTGTATLALVLTLLGLAIWGFRYLART